MSSALLIENSDLKKKVASLEEKNMELAQVTNFLKKIARKNLSGQESNANDLHEIV